MAESGETEPTPDIFGELGEVMTSLDRSALHTQSVIIDHVKNPEDDSAVTLAFGNHAHTLKRSLSKLFCASDYSSDDAVDIAAGILRNDDISRVNFMKNLAREENSDLFIYGYGDQDQTASQIRIAISQFIDEGLDMEDFVESLLNVHIKFMQTDINTLMTTDYVRKRFDKLVRKQDLYEKAWRVGMTAVGTTIGVLAAKAIWSTGKKLR